MPQENIQEIMEEIFQQPHLSPSQIPPLSLYIDQILTLFSTGTAEEQALTKSMVNNYSKEKMLRPIKGKKYTREQVLQILLICRLKSVLSMEQIKMITMSLMTEEDNEAALEDILMRADEQRIRTKETADFFLERMAEEDSAVMVLELTQLSDLFAQAARSLAEKEFSK